MICSFRRLRTELESDRDQMEGAIFDVPCGEMGTPTVARPFKAKIYSPAVGDLNPLVSGLYDLINQDTGGVEADELFDLKLEAAETGFKLGVLAGAILAGK